MKDKMNHRERFFTALDLREPDYVPITDLGLDSPIVDEVLKKEMISLPRSPNKNSMSLQGGASWDSTISYRLAMIEVCRKLDFDAAPALSDYSLTTREYEPKFVDDERFVDQWGRVMQTNVETKTAYFVDGIVHTPEDLENYEPPDAFHPDISEMIEKTMDPLKNEDIVTMAACHSGWMLAFQVRGGIDKIAIDFYRNPSFAKKLYDKVSTACHNFAEVMAKAGVDILFVTDDYADNHGPLINPKLFREYELPNLEKVVEIGKKYNVPILKHSDGNLYPIIEDIVNTGIKGLHPIEPGVMDLRDVKTRFGRRLCLLGNVDCRHVLPYGSEEDVRKDVRRCVDAAAEGGGFILASSNSLHANVKIENIYVMVDEARKYGKYPLRKYR